MWWHSALIYQIYPRSFYDTNGDGVGDLKGVEQKLDYVANLGVDAIWISPFFRSPMKDFGYDISDHRAVDPIFGTLDDFDRVLTKAHEFGLKVMIDQVLSHTSDQHKWFLESQKNQNNPYADWYVWADPKEGGGPPSNWLSIFGGGAWEWSESRQQYYLHNFLVSQPDLNLHSAEVQQALLDVVRFWLDRGVDGLRLDAFNFCFHDPKFRNNPAKDDLSTPRLTTAENPYSQQEHIYDKNRPEMIPWIQKLRRLSNEYSDVALMAEIGDERGIELMAEYTFGEDRLHLAYSFDLLTEQHDKNYIQEVVQKFESLSRGQGRACWSFGNHDVPRLATRWGGRDKVPQHIQRLLALPGAKCLYQGDELGLTQVELAYEDICDPYGLQMWPAFKGRDGCRTPMPWQANAPYAGFSSSQPWLPLPKEHFPMAVDQQESQQNSILKRVKEIIHSSRTQC